MGPDEGESRTLELYFSARPEKGTHIELAAIHKDFICNEYSCCTTWASSCATSPDAAI